MSIRTLAVEAENRLAGVALAGIMVLPDSYAAGEGRVEGIDPEVDGADGPPVVLPLRQAAERLGDVVEQR